MTSVLNVDTIADKAGTGTVTLTKQSAAKAFARLTQTASVDDVSLNVSSGTDGGTGNYTANLTNSFNSAESVVSGSCHSGKIMGPYMTASNAIRYDRRNSSNSVEDGNANHLVGFGDLA